MLYVRSGKKFWMPRSSLGHASTLHMRVCHQLSRAPTLAFIRSYVQNQPAACAFAAWSRMTDSSGSASTSRAAARLRRGPMAAAFASCLSAVMQVYDD